MYVGGCFDKYISAATWPPQIKIPNFVPDHGDANNLAHTSRVGKDLSE